MTFKYLGAIGTCSAPGGTTIWPAARVPGVRTVFRRLALALTLASCLCRSNQPLGLCLLPVAAIHKHRHPWPEALVAHPASPPTITSSPHHQPPEPDAKARATGLTESERRSARAPETGPVIRASSDVPSPMLSPPHRPCQRFVL